MIDTEKFSCYSTNDGVTCTANEDAYAVHNSFVDLQSALGRASVTGTLNAGDLAAYQAVAVSHGLPVYMNLNELAENADAVTLKLQGAGGVETKPPKWFWITAGASVIAVSAIIYVAATTERRAPRRRRARA